MKITNLNYIEEDNREDIRKIIITHQEAFTLLLDTTGFSLYDLKFGRKPNIPSSIQQNPRITYQDLIQKWKKRHELNLQKAKERIEIENEKRRKYLDSKIIKHHPIYKIGDLVKIRNY